VEIYKIATVAMYIYMAIVAWNFIIFFFHCPMSNLLSLSSLCFLSISHTHSLSLFH